MVVKNEGEGKSSGRVDSSTDRVLSILDLFTEQNPVWRPEVLMEKLGVARATMYRYLRALVETGFLTPDGGGGYSLGPRFIEMDRQIRLADPLLQVARPVMRGLRPEFSGDILLCRYYGQSVMSILEDRADPKILANSVLDRGRPFPLFLGAPSRIILANLTEQQQQRLFLRHTQDITAAGLGQNWLEFRNTMRGMVERGYAVASDIDKDLIGISSAVFLPSGEVTGSLCLVKMRQEVGEADIAAYGAKVFAAAKEISACLRKRLDAATVPGEKVMLKANSSARRSSKPGITGRASPRSKSRRVVETE